jgi:rRNA maturation endonuclease Nob1
MKEIFGKNEGNGIFLKKKKNDLTLPRTESREENRDDDGEVKEIGLGHGVSNTPAVQRKKKKGKNGQSARFDKFGKRNMERKISLKQIYQDDLEIKRIVLECNGCGFVSDNSKFCVNCGSLSLVKLESL